jgi:hypothetical protein
MAQSAVLSIGSGSAAAKGTVTLNLDLASSTDVASVEWSLSYGADVVGLSVIPGGAALEAGKSVVCSGATCLAFGPNDTAIANGTLAVVTFQLAATVTGSNIPIQVVAVSAASPAAVPVPASGNTGSIAVLPRSTSVDRGRASASPPASGDASSTVASAAGRRPIPGPVILGLPGGENAMMFSRVDGSLAAPREASRLCSCSAHAIRPGEEAELQVTGLTGAAGSASTPVVLIGGVKAEVTFAGPLPGNPTVISGVEQIRVEQIRLVIPANAPAGDRIPVEIETGDGRSSNSLTIAVAARR